MLAFTMLPVLTEFSPAGVSAHRADVLALCRGAPVQGTWACACPEGTVLVTLVQTVVCLRGGPSPPPTSSEWFKMYGEHLIPKSISILLATRSSFF